MIEVSQLRNNLDELKKKIARKKFECDLDSILDLDSKRRAAIATAEKARSQQKAANSEMSSLPKDSSEFQEKVLQLKELAQSVKNLESVAKQADEEFQEAFLTIPNIPHDSVPNGNSEAENEVLRTSRIDSDYPDSIPHYDIPWFEELIDFPRGVKVTGAGFPFYLGQMSKLVRIDQLLSRRSCKCWICRNPQPNCCKCK